MTEKLALLSANCAASRWNDDVLAFGITKPLRSHWMLSAPVAVIEKDAGSPAATVRSAGSVEITGTGFCTVTVPAVNVPFGIITLQPGGGSLQYGAMKATIPVVGSMPPGVSSRSNPQ